MTDDERVKSIVLAQGWLSRTPESFQRQVLERCLLRKCKPGASIFRKGDPPGGLFGLLSGGLAVDIAPSERGPNMAYFLRPGAHRLPQAFRDIGREPLPRRPLDHEAQHDGLDGGVLEPLSRRNVARPEGTQRRKGAVAELPHYVLR